MIKYIFHYKNVTRWEPGSRIYWFALEFPHILRHLNVFHFWKLCITGVGYWRCQSNVSLTSFLSCLAFYRYIRENSTQHHRQSYFSPAMLPCHNNNRFFLLCNHEPKSVFSSISCFTHDVYHSNREVTKTRLFLSFQKICRLHNCCQQFSCCHWAANNVSLRLLPYVSD